MIDKIMSVLVMVAAVIIFLTVIYRSGVSISDYTIKPCDCSNYSTGEKNEN